MMQDLPVFYAPDVAKDGLLPETEAGHCTRVLRYGVGDKILITDGEGSFYEAQLSEVTKQRCAVKLLSHQPWQKPWQGKLSLYIAPTKATERIEWLLEKAVEIGVDEIGLLRVKHSERKHSRGERLSRVMLSAMKQSQKAILPTLVESLSFSQAMQRSAQSMRLIAHCRPMGEGISQRRTPDTYYNIGMDTAIFIGPEGDFSVEEIRQAEQAGAHGITLGDNRLRTETAGLVALQWLHTLQLIGKTPDTIRL